MVKIIGQILIMGAGMKYLLMMISALSFVACDRNDHASRDKDNTGINVRDRDMRTVTPMDQSETEADRMLTQRIRAAIIEDKNLSTDAKNIKVITINGVVTLRGPVLNEAEKANIAGKVKSVIGIKNVDNQLESKQ